MLPLALLMLAPAQPVATAEDAKLVARNAVRHPLRVPGMVPLLVLSR